MTSGIFPVFGDLNLRKQECFIIPIYRLFEEAMMKTNVIICLFGTVLSAYMSIAVAAEPSVDTCIAAIQKQKPGTLIKLEKLNVAGKPFYEFEVKDAQGAEWEFMCNAESGAITETESESASAENPVFRKNLKVSEKEAIAIALKAHPGTVQEVEYEIESNGDSSYEIDILSDKGVETKVEVNAADGKIIESSTEVWEIGEEPDE